MSAGCVEIGRRLPRYLDDALPAGQARALREHLSHCDSCRAEAASIEPSLLFASARAEEVSSDDVARVLAGVRAGLALRETEAKLGITRSRRRSRAAAIASAAALAAMTLVLPGSARRPVPVTAAAPSAEALAPEVGFSPASEGRAPEVNRTFPADATIYDWNPGAGSSEPRVVWIVDRSLDI